MRLLCTAIACTSSERWIALRRHSWACVCGGPAFYSVPQVLLPEERDFVEGLMLHRTGSSNLDQERGPGGSKGFGLDWGKAAATEVLVLCQQRGAGSRGWETPRHTSTFNLFAIGHATEVFHTRERRHHSSRLPCEHQPLRCPGSPLKLEVSVECGVLVLGLAVIGTYVGCSAGGYVSAWALAFRCWGLLGVALTSSTSMSQAATQWVQHGQGRAAGSR
jgi:hypothetical protein